MIEVCSFSEIEPFKRLASKESVTLANPEGAEWYCIRNNAGEIISFFCFVQSGYRARFKSNYTLKNYRGNGCLNAFIDFALNECKKRGIEYMDVFVTEMSKGSHLRHGAKEIRQTGHITYLKYEMDYEEL